MTVDPAFWHGKRVLLTGNTGFKGAWLTLWLTQLGAEVRGFSNGIPTSPSLHEATRLSEVVEWACVLGSGRLSARVVELALSQRIAGVAREDAREYVELRRLLDVHGWDTERASRALGVHRATLYRRMKRHSLVTPLASRQSAVSLGKPSAAVGS